MASPTLSSLGFGFEQRVVVGIAEMAVSNNPAAVLTTYSLGSCLGLALYDPTLRVGGLLHVMLPESSIAREKANAQPCMFVDTGLPALLQQVQNLRADLRRLRVYVVGGAQIMDDNGFFNIGRRNYAATIAILDQWRLRITAEQVGGLVNRTVHLKLATGEMRLKVSGQSMETTL